MIYGIKFNNSSRFRLEEIVSLDDYGCVLIKGSSLDDGSPFNIFYDVYADEYSTSYQFMNGKKLHHDISSILIGNEFCHGELFFKNYEDGLYTFENDVYKGKLGDAKSSVLCTSGVVFGFMRNGLLDFKGSGS